MWAEDYDQDLQAHLNDVEVLRAKRACAKDCECKACVLDLPDEPEMMQAWLAK